MDLLDTLPKLFYRFISFTLILPIISLLLGYDAGFSSHLYHANFLYFQLYHWSIVLVSALIILFVYLDFNQTTNTLSYTIGIAGVFTLIFSAVTSAYIKVFSSVNLVMVSVLIWFFSNAFTGLLLGFGLFLDQMNLTLRRKSHLQLYFLVLLTISALFTQFLVVNYLPKKNALLIIELSCLINFFIYIFIFFSCYKKEKQILIRSLLYISIIQCIMSLFILLGIFKHYDAAYFGSSFLQFLCYLIILMSLMLKVGRNFAFFIQLQKKVLKEKADFERLSYEDSLTCLGNRRGFEREMTRVLSSAKRNNRKFALILIDINHFKIINDTFGHQLGDHLLKILSEKIKNRFRVDDYCARLGGDEFAIIMSDVSQVKNETQFQVSLASDVEIHAVIEEQSLNMTVSVGSAFYPEEGETLEQLYKHADKLMYINKIKG